MDQIAARMYGVVASIEEQGCTGDLTVTGSQPTDDNATKHTFPAARHFPLKMHRECSDVPILAMLVLVPILACYAFARPIYLRKAKHLPPPTLTLATFLENFEH